MGSQPPPIELLSLTDLEAVCRRETEHYRQGKASDPRFCLEIFRRALQQLPASAVPDAPLHGNNRVVPAYVDEDARALLVRIYSPYVRAQLKHANAPAASLDDLEQQVWLRFWQAARSADQLAAYILGTSTGTEQLMVAAHVRQCPMCQYTVAAIRRPEPRRRTLIATLLPLPLAEGQRRSARHGETRQYQAEDLIVKLTVSPPSREYWRITGRVLRADKGLADRSVTLRTGRRRYQQTSDAQGFFSFGAVSAGQYTLVIEGEQVQVQIRDLVLSLDDDGRDEGA